MLADVLFELRHGGAVGLGHAPRQGIEAVGEVFEQLGFLLGKEGGAGLLALAGVQLQLQALALGGFELALSFEVLLAGGFGLLLLLSLLGAQLLTLAKYLALQTP